MPVGFATAMNAVGGILSSGLNFGMQAATNAQNQANLEKAWARDDTAISRARADAVNAGFSPLAALSGSLGNTNPGNLSAPQMANPFSDAASSYVQEKSNEIAEKVANEQVTGLQLDNKAKELENGVLETKLQDELYKSKLDIADKIGVLLDANVIQPDDIPDAYKMFKKNTALESQRQIERDKVQAQKDANAVAREKIQADKEEREWQHNSEEKTHTVRNKVSFSVMGQDYELEVTDTTNSSTTAVMAGVNPSDSAHPVASYDYKGFISYPVINDRGDRQCFYVGISTQKGLPCYSDGRAIPTYYVAIPTTTGISYYKINRGDISMSNNGKEANWPKNSWDSLWSN